MQPAPVSLMKALDCFSRVSSRKEMLFLLRNLGTVAISPVDKGRPRLGLAAAGGPCGRSDLGLRWTRESTSTAVIASRTPSRSRMRMSSALAAAASRWVCEVVGQRHHGKVRALIDLLGRGQARQSVDPSP